MGKKAKKRIKSKNNYSYNIKLIRKNIKHDLYSQYFKEEEKANKNMDNFFFFNKSPEEEEKDYYNRYKQYISEQFNSTIVNMFILYINRKKDLPINYQKESNFINKFINLIKDLLMNELELSCFTLLLDEMGWEYPDVNHWTYFYILGIFSKKICGREEESSLLNNIFDRKDNNFINYYTTICEEEKINNFVEQKFSIKLLNERFKQLNRFINSYCRKNFINYNGVVDKIVKLSQPYGEESKGIQLYKDEKINENMNNNLKLDLMGDYKEINDDKNNIPNNDVFQQLIPNPLNEQSRHFIHNKYNNNDLNLRVKPMLSLNLFRENSSQLSIKSIIKYFSYVLL